MIFEFFPVLGFWSGLGWGLAGCVIAFLALLMILSIVFLQDSKEGGLGGAFGSAGGGDSVLGASGQQGIVKVTAVMSIIFFVLVIGWGMIGSDDPGPAKIKTDDVLKGVKEAVESSGSLTPGVKPATGTGAGVSPAPAPADGKTGGGESSDGSGK
ncbi:MAG: preprotein translocase subunit SecG [Planctomycetaceae bacterium]|nr:preprotein translocase subunit SecG [Planctomycetaceae bacterium]